MARRATTTGPARRCRGRTVPKVVSQLEVARRCGVTSRAVGQRVQRVGRAGAALPLYPRVRRELTRPARNG